MQVQLAAMLSQNQIMSYPSGTVYTVESIHRCQEQDLAKWVCYSWEGTAGAIALCQSTSYGKAHPQHTASVTGAHSKVFLSQF